MGIQWYTWVYTGIHWYTWVYTGIQWYTWVYMGIHGYTVVYMGIQWYTWVYSGIHGYTGVYTGIQWYTWVYSSIHGYTGVYMGIQSVRKAHHTVDHSFWTTLHRVNLSIKLPKTCANVYDLVKRSSVLLQNKRLLIHTENCPKMKAPIPGLMNYT